MLLSSGPDRLSLRLLVVGRWCICEAANECVSVVVASKRGAFGHRSLFVVVRPRALCQIGVHAFLSALALRIAFLLLLLLNLKWQR